jgi:hypothetical protein
MVNQQQRGVDDSKKRFEDAEDEKALDHEHGEYHQFLDNGLYADNEDNAAVVAVHVGMVKIWNHEHLDCLIISVWLCR